MENVSFIMAFAAGVIVFLSPCILPLIPSYISYLTGISFGEFSSDMPENRKKRILALTVAHSLCFILGFTAIFVILGASATLLGKALFRHLPLIQKIGGVLIIFFGLAIMDVIKVPFLQREKKLSFRKKGASFLGSVAVGATFAAAWTPCVGPILGSILVYASSAESVARGIKLLVAFSLGLALPFLLSALIINSFLAFLRKIEKYMKWIKIAGGAMLIIFGVILFTKGGLQ